MYDMCDENKISNIYYILSSWLLEYTYCLYIYHNDHSSFFVDLYIRYILLTYVYIIKRFMLIVYTPIVLYHIYPWNTYIPLYSHYSS